MGFEKDFLWGAASAAFQIEGAWNEDGKTPGIWDALLEGRARHGEDGHVSCNHYHHMEEDIRLMKEIGLKSYRFSISWSRVMPEPGVLNEKGLDFYIRLVTRLREAEIEPLCTLFHWNLPMWVHERGGWANPKIIYYFTEYAQAVVDALSDKVSYWFTFNEPQIFVNFGYAEGIEAPFYREPLPIIKQITKNIMLCHGYTVQMIRQRAKLPSKIGFAPTGPVYVPLHEELLMAKGTPLGDALNKDIIAMCTEIGSEHFTEEQIEEARRKTYEIGCRNAATNSWWADPIVLGEIPEELRDTLNQEDIEVIHQPLDFYAFNVYTSRQGEEDANRTEKRPCLYPGMPRTSLGWPIVPEVMYWATKFHYERYHLPIMISENGMANIDFVMEDEKVHDPQRIDYIRRHLRSLKRAVEEGIPVIGYQYWSLMDNMEWCEGYDPRFGLIHIDYRTSKRTLKDSAYEYAKIIRTNGETI